MIMQIMVLATQNAMPADSIGTGTAAVTFFRSLGGAFGTSLFGAVFIAGLSHWIPVLVPGAAAAGIHVHGSFSMSPAELHAFPPHVQYGILDSFVRSLHTVFLLGVPIASVMLVFTLFLKQVPLRSMAGLRATHRGPGHVHGRGRTVGRRVRRGRARGDPDRPAVPRRTSGHGSSIG